MTYHALGSGNLTEVEIMRGESLVGLQFFDVSEGKRTREDSIVLYRDEMESLSKILAEYFPSARTTADLVRELEGREGVETMEIPEDLVFEIRQNRLMTLGADEELSNGKGPATILVVRGERE